MLLVFAVSATLLQSGCTSGKALMPDEVDVKAYESGSIENDRYSLSLDPEDGRVMLTDKRDGRRIYSYPEDLAGRIAEQNRVKSALILSVYVTDMNAIYELNSQVSSVNKGGLRIERYKNEFVAVYCFESENITVPVHYTLQGDRLVVTILPDEIREEGTSRILDVDLHPFFSSGRPEDEDSGRPADEGFLVIPDGSGALVEFNQASMTEYSQKVYSQDQSLYKISNVRNEQPVCMPIFGIGRKNDGLTLGVITGGAGDASVKAVAGSKNMSYNSAWASFNILPRDTKHYPNDSRIDVYIYPDKAKDTGPLQVSYLFAAEDEPDYVQLAFMYQKYLVDELGLKRIQEDAYPMVIDLYMATVKKKSFLGFPYDGIQVLTTFKQAADIIGRFQKEGIKTVIRLKNWSDQSVWGKSLSGADMISDVGSRSELKELAAAALQNGELYLSGNLSEVYKGGGLFPKTFTYAKNMQDFAAEYQEFNLVTKFRKSEHHYLLSLSNMLWYAKEFNNAVAKLGEDIGVGIDGLYNLYTDYSQEKVSLTSAASYYEAAFAVLINRPK